MPTRKPASQPQPSTTDAVGAGATPIETTSWDVVAAVWARSTLTDDEAMRIALEETHAARAVRAVRDR